MSKIPHKKSQRIKRSDFLQNLTYLGSYNVPSTVELIRYNEHEVVTSLIQPDKPIADEIKQDYVSWFRVTGFSDVNRINNICKAFGIQRFDIKDLLSDLQVTKIVAYEKSTFIMASGCFVDDHRLKVEQIAFILGKNYIVSFQEYPSTIFDDVIAAIKDSRFQLRDNKADYLLYILLSGVHSQQIDDIYQMNNELDEMEDLLIERQLTDRAIMKFFRDKRKNSALLRRSIFPLREEFSNLMHNPNGLIDNANLIYFNDIEDRLRTSLEEIEMLNDTIASLMDLYFNNNNLKMNDIIKKLTIVSTIFIPLTFMVGVWGMNFRIMPELEWKYGYIFSWGIMIIIAIIAILFLKRKRWF